MSNPFSSVHAATALHDPVSVDRWPMLGSVSTTSSSSTIGATHLESAAARPSFDAGLQRILDNSSLDQSFSSAGPDPFGGRLYPFYSAQRPRLPARSLRGDPPGGLAKPLPTSISNPSAPAHRLTSEGFLPVVPEAFAAPAGGSSPVRGLVSLPDCLHGLFASSAFPAHSAPSAGFPASADLAHSAGPRVHENAPDGAHLRASLAPFLLPPAREHGHAASTGAVAGRWESETATCVAAESAAGFAVGDCGRLLGDGSSRWRGAPLERGDPVAAEASAWTGAPAAEEHRAREQRQRQQAELAEGGGSVGAEGGLGGGGMVGDERMWDMGGAAMGVDLGLHGSHGAAFDGAAATGMSDLSSGMVMSMRSGLGMDVGAMDMDRGGRTPMCVGMGMGMGMRMGMDTPMVDIEAAVAMEMRCADELLARTASMREDDAPALPREPAGGIEAAGFAHAAGLPLGAASMEAVHTPPPPAATPPLSAPADLTPPVPAVASEAPPLSPLSPLALYSRRNSWPAAPLPPSADAALMQALELERLEHDAAMASVTAMAAAGAAPHAPPLSMSPASLPPSAGLSGAVPSNARPCHAMAAAAEESPFLPALGFSSPAKRAKPLQRQQQQQEGVNAELLLSQSPEPQPLPHAPTPAPAVATARPAAPAVVSLAEVFRMEALMAGGGEGEGGREMAWEGEGRVAGARNSQASRHVEREAREGERREGTERRRRGGMEAGEGASAGQCREAGARSPGDAAMDGRMERRAMSSGGGRGGGGSATRPSTTLPCAPESLIAGQGSGVGRGGEGSRCGGGAAKRATREGGEEEGSGRAVRAAKPASAAGGGTGSGAGEMCTPATVPVAVCAKRPGPWAPSDLTFSLTHLPKAAPSVHDVLARHFEAPQEHRPGVAPAVHELLARRHTVSSTPSLRQHGFRKIMPHPSLPFPVNPSPMPSLRGPLPLSPCSLASLHLLPTTPAAAAAAVPSAPPLFASQPPFSAPLAMHPHAPSPPSTTPAPLPFLPTHPLPFRFRTPPLPPTSPPLCVTPRGAISAGGGGSSSSSGSAGGAGCVFQSREPPNFIPPTSVLEHQALQASVFHSLSKRSLSSSMLPSSTLPTPLSFPPSAPRQPQTFLPLSAAPPAFASSSSLLPFLPNNPQHDPLRCLGCGIELDQENAKEALALPEGVGPPLPPGSEMLAGRIPRVHGCNECLPLLVPSYFSRRAAANKHTPNKST
ncbi:hypothetical protein CLOM_g6840 [Closterium sp. NIES-68]|nr:hypothetical protein CLOM_g6840 [Closterium sp. NIES-68]GJP72375.1 hypothetical protein CLOP_g3114 [Closterium sp. NIES-67]